jgi:5-formyltetrahydrofolate cyclo-ligase
MTHRNLSSPARAQPAFDRAAQRAEKIAARESLASVEHARLSEALEAHLTHLLDLCRPKVLGFCWPYRAEFDCRPLIERWIARGTHACLPLVSASEKVMRFREWRPESPMLTDRYGIHYPAEGPILDPEVLLIPVNAFDCHGFRLGYGNGHFDHTLANIAPRPLAIGIGFELARVASVDPHEHDIAMDAVVTEQGTEYFSQRSRTLAG